MSRDLCTLKRDEGEELSGLDSLELNEVVIITTTGQRVVSASVSELQKSRIQGIVMFRITDQVSGRFNTCRDALPGKN